MGIIRNQEPVVHTEYSIQKLIYKEYYPNIQYMVPNMHYPLGLGEMDIFFVRTSGYAEEFEIKVSTADFKADVKKRFKHQVLLETFLGSYSYGRYMLPNRFSYVVSEAVNLDCRAIPEYAGLYVARNKRIDCIKRPLFIHKNKLVWDKKVAKSVSFRYLRQYFRI